MKIGAIFVSSMLPFLLMGQSGPEMSGGAVVAPGVPIDIIYLHLFKNVAKYQVLASAEEALNRSSAFRHSFRTKLGLNPSEEEDLNNIATSCDSRLRLIQVRASSLMQRYRQLYPVGHLKNGLVLPPPPPELAALEAEKTAVVRSSVGELRTALGDSEFRRVDLLITKTIAPGIVRPSSR